jgi:L-asparaginase II
VTGPGRSALLAEVVRSGVVEGRHVGSVVGLAADGAAVLRAGEPEALVLPRSSNKPVQAVAMLRAGLQLDGELLALAASSHSGEPFHLEGVQHLLARAGLDERALRCVPDLPLDEQERSAWLRAGRGPVPLAMNCSGKHAAMLATCVVAGWDVEGYLDPDHPLQRAVAATLADLTAEPVGAVAVDGCGAPLFGTSLLGLARAFRAIATAVPGTPERRVADAVRAHPATVGGTRRDVTALLRAVPGLVAKDGAEGVYAAALPDGRAVALKVDDGAGRARPPVLVAALRALGVDAPGLDDVARTPVLGGGRVVGEVRALPLSPGGVARTAPPSPAARPA